METVMKLKILGVFAFALVVAACAATPTRYAPSVAERGVGFSEYRVEPGRYRVTFHGGPGAPPAQVEDYALLRAAEITLRDGFDWFQVAQAYGERSGADSGPQISVGGGGGSFGRHSGVGLGVGTSFNLGGGPAYSRTLEVVLGKGAKPSTPDAYDARGLTSTVGARAAR
jgi:hypothetical protein